MKRTILAMIFAVLLFTVPVFESSVRFPISAGFDYQTAANPILLKFDFPAPTIAADISGDSITMSALPQYGAPGEPVLPFRQVNILIPQGKEAKNVEVAPGIRKIVDGQFRLTYGKTPMPISSNETVNDRPNEAIYGSTSPFPGSLYSDASEQNLRGYKILTLKINPVQYIPKTGQLCYFQTVTLTVTLENTDEVSPFFRKTPADKELAVSLCENAGAADTYTQMSPGLHAAEAQSSNHYDCVIITSNALRNAFQPLADWRTQNGLNATIVTVEDIMKNPDYNSNGKFGDGTGSPYFNDTQAHVRNFIRDAYINWGIEYVLLGADDDIIPARGVYDYAADLGGNYTDYNIPCDLYYGGLDGSWDKNNDTIFGEGVFHVAGPENGTAGEEADFFAEVYVGRAPVDTVQKATNFVTKTIAYEQSTQAAYLKQDLLIATKLDDITEGGNGLDEVTNIIPQFAPSRLYSRDGTFSSPAVISAMNAGTHIVINDGHSNFQAVMGLSISDVDNLNNTAYFFAYSLGCFSAAFDQATSGPQGAIAEHFVFDQHGAFAYVGNSRYGWYCSASLDGPGERYERSFFSTINSGTRNLGKALQLSKENEPILDRWTYFDLNLLGDPATPLVTQFSSPTAHLEPRTDLLTLPRIGGTVPVLGTATRGAATGATFSHYSVAYGIGTSPTSWESTGISLTGGGVSEVVNGTLATWSTQLVSPGTYTLRLIVYDVNGSIGQDKQIVQVSSNSLPIHIRANGTVDPPTAPIQQNGNLYTLTSNIFSDSEGIIVERNDTVLDGAGYAVQGSGGGGAGVYLSGLSNVTVKNLVVESHLYGVYLQQCLNCTIIQTSVQTDTHGIFLIESSNNNILETNVTNNYDGISLLSFSNNNTIAMCTITGNNGKIGEGIYLYMSSNNLIYHNMFAANTLPVYDAAWDCADPQVLWPSANNWDNGYPSGGNYWDTYNCTDQFKGPYQNITGSDGIGDSAYTIDANNRDNYPLTSFYLSSHDVAVTDVAPLKNIAGQGYCANISLIIMNYGEFDESFNVSVSVNSTLVGRTGMILKASNAAVIVFVWNTSGFVYGNYSIQVAADAVPGETNTTNNLKTSVLLVHVGCPGDVSSSTPGVYDWTVNMKDVALMISLFNTKPSSHNWNPNADVNNDGVCNMRDIAIAINNFNKHE